MSRQDERARFHAEMRAEGVEPDFEPEPIRCGEWVTCERNPERHPAVPTCLEPRRVAR